MLISDKQLEPKAWLITGSKMYTDAVTISKHAALSRKTDRGKNDTSGLVPLYDEPTLSAAILSDLAAQAGDVEGLVQVWKQAFLAVTDTPLLEGEGPIERRERAAIAGVRAISAPMLAQVEGLKAERDRLEKLKPLWEAQNNLNADENERLRKANNEAFAKNLRLEQERDRLTSKLQMLTEMIEGDVTECEGMCPVVDRLTQELAEAKHQRGVLAEAIGELVVKLGIAQNVPMTGPELLLMLQGVEHIVASTETRVRQECAEIVRGTRIQDHPAPYSAQLWLNEASDAILHGQQVHLVCEWAYDHEDRWDTSCGTSWLFIDGGPAENGVKYCHGCGKPIKILG